MSYKTKIIASLNQKGGVGKTTTIANLGFALANMGRDVLLIDFDSQASLTNYLNVGLGDEEVYGIVDLLVKDLEDPDYTTEEIEDSTWDELLAKCIVKPTYRGRVNKQDADIAFGFDLIPSTLQLSDYDLWVTKNHMDGFETVRLRSVIEKVLEYHEYDYILIDCSPYLGVLTLNAVVASQTGCLIPTNLDLMSTRGVKNLIEVIVQVQESIMFRPHNGEIVETGDIHYGVLGVILNLYREGRSVDTTIQNDIQRYYPFEIFKNTIPESVNAKKAVLGGLIYSQVYAKARDSYTKLAKEIEKQIKKMEKEAEKGDKRALIKHLGEGSEEHDYIITEGEDE